LNATSLLPSDVPWSEGSAAPLDREEDSFSEPLTSHSHGGMLWTISQEEAVACPSGWSSSSRARNAAYTPECRSEGGQCEGNGDEEPVSTGVLPKAEAWVSLSIYDLSKHAFVGLLNRAAAPLGVGGAFHVAVEVFGHEWSYGWTAQGSGIGGCLPHQDPNHMYQTSVPLGTTRSSKLEFSSVMRQLPAKWLGPEYNIIHHNCIHFAQALVELLGVGPVPKWVVALSRHAEAVTAPMQRLRTTSSVASSTFSPRSVSSSPTSGGTSQTCVLQ